MTSASTTCNSTIGLIVWLPPPRQEDALVQAIQGAFKTLEQGQRPVLANLGDRCNVAASPHYWLLERTCILEQFTSDP